MERAGACVPYRSIVCLMQRGVGAVYAWIV